MIIEIFRQSLSAQSATLAFAFKRCTFKIEGSRILWIYCSENYFNLLDACKPLVALWAHRSGFTESIKFIIIATPDRQIHWL